MGRGGGGGGERYCKGTLVCVCVCVGGVIPLQGTFLHLSSYEIIGIHISNCCPLYQFNMFKLELHIREMDWVDNWYNMIVPIC